MALILAAKRLLWRAALFLWNTPLSAMRSITLVAATNSAWAAALSPPSTTNLQNFLHGGTESSTQAGIVCTVFLRLAGAFACLGAIGHMKNLLISKIKSVSAAFYWRCCLNASSHGLFSANGGQAGKERLPDTTKPGGSAYFPACLKRPKPNQRLPETLSAPKFRWAAFQVACANNACPARLFLAPVEPAIHICRHALAQQHQRYRGQRQRQQHAHKAQQAAESHQGENHPKR